jgi:hypothetical protein
MNRRARLLCLLPLLFAACALGRQEQSEPIDAAIVGSLKPGSTTAREVTERLGAPTEVVQLGKRTAYRYDALTQKAAVLLLLVVNIGNVDSRTDRLWLFFDEKDVLTHYGASYGTHRTQYAMPWENVHEAEDGAARDLQRSGLGK